MSSSSGREPKLGVFSSLVRSMTSWRTASVSLLSFSSGLPLGLVWYSIPDWMRDIGVDIRIVGLFTLAQAPWAFKVLWSPLIDRFAPPFWGRRRGWMALTQVFLVVLCLVLSGVGDHPDAIWVVGAVALAVALASASFDIAYDAYAVEILRPDEHGAVVGARTAFYRLAMVLSGGAAITFAGQWGWGTVNACLAIAYLPMLIISWKAPEPTEKYPLPLTLRDAVWKPFLGLLSRHRAIEILAFVVLYKFADQLAQALTRPFLNDMGYSAAHRGIALASVGALATILGAFLGGWVTTLVGLGPALWLFGFLQIFSNLGYFILASSEHSLVLMYGATGFELFTSGLGTGAFFVLLLRMTQKRFSATQYALFSSLFALPRLLTGTVAGFMVDAVGWQWFFLSTIGMGLPGMVMLARFVPLGVKEPHFIVEERKNGELLTSNALIVRGCLGTLFFGLIGCLLVSTLAALKVMRIEPELGFDLGLAFASLLTPVSVADWIQISGLIVGAAIGGLLTAAVYAARR